MEAIISDQSAMDPEVIVHEGSGRLRDFRARVWKELPNNWALAVFIATGAAVNVWSPKSVLWGIVLSALTTYLKSILELNKLEPGLWFSILEQASKLAAVASGLCSAMKHMGGAKLRNWLVEHISGRAELASISVLLFITLLFVLGLERSNLLRKSLLVVLSIAVYAISIENALYVDEALSEEVNKSEASLKEVVGSAAFFSFMYSGVMEKQTCSFSGFGPLMILCLSSGSAVVFLATVVGKGSLKPDTSVIDALEHNSVEVLGSKARDVWLTRDGLAVMAVVSLALSLVEVLAEAMKTMNSLADVLPAKILKINPSTLTQLRAMLSFGMVSVTLTLFNTTTNLITISSASYLLAQSLDIIYFLHWRYHPVFEPIAKLEVVEGGGDYELVPDNQRLVESEESEQDEISGDSGHSTDADIDQIVHEYRENIKIFDPHFTPQHPKPTHSSHRFAMFALFCIVCTALGMAAPVVLDNGYTVAFAILEILMFSCIIWRQPIRLPGDTLPSLPRRLCNEESSSKPAFVYCAVLSLTLTMLATLLLQGAVWPIVAWAVLGSVPRLIGWLCKEAGFSATRHDIFKIQVPRPPNDDWFHLDHNSQSDSNA